MRTLPVIVACALLQTINGCRSAPASTPAASTAPPPPVVYPRDEPQSVGFVHVLQDQVLDGKNQPILLRGVAFGNQVWQNVADPRKHHSEADYARLAAMHMNAVRFYLNAITLEDENAPGQYKAAGWAWLDDNIAWAKRHGIYLILNMHFPPGGYQSLGAGKGLWENPDAQQRFIAMWKAIATRYRGEPIIAGYDLLNEPVVTRSIDQWKTLAESTISAIRQVDPNHAFFVERVNGVGSSWAENADRNFFRVGDPNVVYEFHFYKPLHFTHQNAHWVDFAAESTRYPDSDRVGVEWYNTEYRSSVSQSPSIPKGDSNWKRYVGPAAIIKDPSLVLGRPVLACAKNSGKVWFDDVTIEQIDPRGQVLKTIRDENIKSRRGWYLWSENGIGNAGSETTGHADALSLSISGTTADANLSAEYLQFRLEQGATYRIAGWMKGQAVPVDAKCNVRLDLYASRVPLFAWDRAFLGYEIDGYVAWGKKNRVPLFLGEFGAVRQAFDAERGGVRWASDMIDLLNERGLHFTYHDYHEVHMGMFYGDDTLPDPANANTPLMDLFRSKLGAM